jgi:hypothetical protein
MLSTFACLSYAIVPLICSWSFHMSVLLTQLNHKASATWSMLLEKEMQVT